LHLQCLWIAAQQTVLSLALFVKPTRPMCGQLGAEPVLRSHGLQMAAQTDLLFAEVKAGTHVR